MTKKRYHVGARTSGHCLMFEFYRSAPLRSAEAQMAQSTPILFTIELPADNYGVLVENEIDARRLLYLVSIIGEEKVRASAKKCRFQPIFVSELLRRFRVVVPVATYAATDVPFYRVYLLALASKEKFKIGWSGNWLHRAFAFTSKDGLEALDLDASIAFSFQGDRRTAKAAERSVLSTFGHASESPPSFLAYGVSGRTEWLNMSVYDDVVTSVAGFQSDATRPRVSLRQAIELDSLLRESICG